KDSWRAQRNIGRVYRKMGLIKKAVVHYKEAIKLNPFSAVIRNDLGGIYGMEGRYIDAIDEFHQALALDPHLDLAQTNLEQALQMLDKK
ncbi:MAG: tetratricopeptide repeat protein, partial [Thermodesulfobacteriota bacterium]